jgi:hypothetical protein
MPRRPNRLSSVSSMLPAFACSGVLHLAGAVLLGLLLARAFVGGFAPRETLVIADDTGRRPALIALERRKREAEPARRVVTPGPVAQVPVAVAPRFAPPVLPQRGEQPGGMAASVPVRHTGPAPLVVVAAAGVAAPAAPEVASPAPAVAERQDVEPPPSPLATQASDLSAGGWGQNFAKPLIADEAALDDLRAKYHGTANVMVDETGRATKVVVIGALPPDVRLEIETRLLSLHYVPAECNGLRCGGTLSVNL